MRVAIPLLSALLLACQPPPVSEKPDPPGDDTGPDTRDTRDTRDTQDTQDTELPVDTVDTGTLDYDCDALPEGDEVEGTTFGWASGYHDLVFDTEGHIAGQDQMGNMMKATYDGEAELWIPGIGWTEGMDRMPDGSIVYASGNAIMKLNTDGGRETLVGSTGGANGVTVGPDHKVYYANTGVFRVDPETLELEEIVPRTPQLGARHIVFNLDSTRLYIATLARGDVWYIELDEDLNRASDVTLFAEGVGGGWHDGIAIDVCGNLYVPEYYDMSLFRIDTEGTVELLGRPNAGLDYGHGVEFGSGIGGWKTGALYLPLPYNQNKVKEVWVGAPSGHLVRTWNGEAVEPW